MATISDKYIKHPNIVCIGDTIQYTFIISNGADAKYNSKGEIISGGKTLAEVIGRFDYPLSGHIDSISVTKGIVENEVWTIYNLKDGEEATAVVNFIVDDDCVEEFKMQLTIDCMGLCVIKKVKPLTCCQVKTCTRKGELDCSQLTI